MKTIAIKAHLLNEQGKPTKSILPPRNTRSIRTEAFPPGTLLSDSDWARRSVFAIAIEATDPPSVLLYNGGFETQYISHEDLIAKVIPL